jgi:cellulase/cellobiase CelA1
VKADQIETYAETAYQRYGDAVGWLAVSGHPMPRWEALQPRIRGAWCEAARGALGLPAAVAPGALAPKP